jgi:hypothetical protein
MNSGRRTAALPAVGFPIRTPPDQSLVSGSPKLFAATRVLPRLLSPRHPSCALCSLVIVSSSSTFSSRRPRSNAVLLPGLTGSSPALLSLHLRICNYQRPVLQIILSGGARSRRAIPANPRNLRVAQLNGADRNRTDDIQLAKLAVFRFRGPVRCSPSAALLRCPLRPPRLLRA